MDARPRRRAGKGREAARVHDHHAGRVRDQGERIAGDPAAVPRRRRERISAARRWHVDQLALVQRRLRRDAPLVADGRGSGADALLRRRSCSASRSKHQLFRRRLADAHPLRVGPNGGPGSTRRAVEGGAAPSSGAGAGAPALQHVEDRRGACHASQLQGQPDERGTILERVRVGSRRRPSVLRRVASTRASAGESPRAAAQP